jgi:hypothetical protein
VTAEDIADGEDGKVLWFGRLRGLNTNAFNEGDILYASTTSAGGFQTAIPTGSNNIVQVSAVIKKSINQGVIFIRPQIEPVLFKPISGTGVNGQVSFWDGANSQSGDNGLFWDNTNKRLGIGTATPVNTLDVVGQRIRHNGTTSATAVSTLYELNDTTSANKSYILFGVDTTGGIVGSNVSGTYISNGREASGAIRDMNIHNFVNANINFWTSNSQRLRIFGNGNIGINTTTDAGFKLDVNGTARVQGNTTITPAGLTGSEATSALDISQTWNTTGTPTAIKLNITDTASNAGSFLADFQVGGVSRVSIRKDGTISFRLGSTIRASNGSNAIATSAANGLNLISSLSTAAGGVSDFIFVNNQGNPTNTTGTRLLVDLQRGFAPTSGTGQYIDLRLLPTINQTGGANGITRGLFINPTLTSAADWRAIEVSNGGAYINTTSVQASAILQADSTTKGFLPPRMTNAERLAIASPAVGLIVYCTDATEGLYVNKSTGWTFVI